jgi:hypothetical protein
MLASLVEKGFLLKEIAYRLSTFSSIHLGWLQALNFC